MQNVSMIYMTAPNMNEAKRISRALVEERLAACVNIIDNMTSVYWWKGQMEEAIEVAMLAKTQTSKVEALIARLKGLHPHDAPCALSFEISAGHPDYIEWPKQETP